MVLPASTSFTTKSNLKNFGLSCIAPEADTPAAIINPTTDAIFISSAPLAELPEFE